MKPNGRNIEVTDENKQEYLTLILEYRMLGSIAEQLQEFLAGLYEIVPKAMLTVFDYQEMEFFMCGMPDISVQDWKKNTVIRYAPDTSKMKQDKLLGWFWEVLENFNEEQRARLLQFATGSCRVPVEGFKVCILLDALILLRSLCLMRYLQIID